MNILVEIGHPAHVHFFGNMINLWEENGHEVIVVSRDKDITNALLDEYGIPYLCASRQAQSRPGLVFELLKRWLVIFRLIKRHSVDVVVSIAGISTAVPGKLAGIKVISDSDTEDALFTNDISFRFSDIVTVPRSFLLMDRYNNLLPYNSFHELAYLHPRYFSPNPDNLKLYGLSPQEDYFLIRLVQWKALHDIEQKGIALNELDDIVSFLLERDIRPCISSEHPLPERFRRYLITGNYSGIFDLVAFSRGYLGESPTMAMEAGILGRPSIWVSSRVGKLGYIREMEEQFGLVRSFQEFAPAIETMKTMLRDPRLEENLEERVERMLREKEDVTRWMADLVVS